MKSEVVKQIIQTYLVYVSSYVFVLNDDQQFVVTVFLVQKGHRTLLRVTLLQQVFLQHESTCNNYTSLRADF